MYPPITAMQRLGKNITAATNTQAKREELLDVSFSLWPMSFQKKVGHHFFPELVQFLLYQNKLCNRITIYCTYLTCEYIPCKFKVNKEKYSQ
jgi:hypothetical protein